MEAALAKLGWLLGQEPALDVEEVRVKIGTNLRGELTETSTETQFSLTNTRFIRTVYMALLEGETDEVGEGGAMSDVGGDGSGMRFVERALLPTLLCSAAGLGAINELKDMLEGGASPDSADYDGRTPIHLASSEGHLACVQHLIEIGADLNVVDRFGGTPLADAVKHGRKEVAKVLFAAGARLGMDTAEVCGILCNHAKSSELEKLADLIQVQASGLGVAKRGGGI